MLTVQVSRWSQAAARLVHPQQVLIGRVHSCYARIINLQTPAGRLLTFPSCRQDIEWNEPGLVVEHRICTSRLG